MSYEIINQLVSELERLTRERDQLRQQVRTLVEFPPGAPSAPASAADRPDPQGGDASVLVDRLRHENHRLHRELALARIEVLEAGQVKSAFLANMSHEFRTPLNTILGYSEILIDDAGPQPTEPSPLVADLRKIHDAGRHLLALIDGVLDLAQIEAGQMVVASEPFAIRPAVDEVIATVEPLAARTRNRLTVECPEAIGQLVTDRVKFRLALFHLLANAAKFTEDGQIGLRVSTAVRDAVDWVRFAVSDTGIGLEPEQIGRLFGAFVQADPSTTRRHGGAGLGLALTRQFCHLLGGEIRVSSQVGQGSTFTLELPRHPRPDLGRPAPSV